MLGIALRVMIRLDPTIISKPQRQMFKYVDDQTDLQQQQGFLQGPTGSEGGRPCYLGVTLMRATRHHELGFGRSIADILPTSLPELPV